MKRKLLISILAMVFFVTSGCGASANVPADTDATAKIGTEAIAETGTDTAEKTEEPTAASEAAGSDETPDEAVGESVYSGGYPWIDSDLKENISEDMPVDPKDDFHLYVNKEWLLTTELRGGESAYFVEDMCQDKIDANALLLLDDDTLKSHDAELVQTFYHVLMDWDARNKAGLEPLRKTVQDIQDIESLEELSDFICDPERNILVPLLIRFENGIPLDFADRYVTEIETDRLTLGDAAEYTYRTEVGDRTYKAYAFLLRAILTRLGYSGSEADQMISDMFSIEGAIAERSMTTADIMSPDYYEKINNKYVFDELSTLTKSYPLTRMLKSRMFDGSEQYLVLEPEAVKRVDELYTEDNLEKIKNYMILGYLMKTSSYLDREAYDVTNEALNIENGTTGSRDDERQTLDIIKEHLRVPINKLYLEKYDATEKKKRVTKICEEVLHEYRKMLSEEDWLTYQTKEKAIEKLDAMTIHAVFPEKWTDYSSLDLSGLSLYDCITEITRYEKELDRMRINGTVDHEIRDLYIDYLEANAYYDLSDNSINILLGHVEEPFYYDGISDEALLGGLGRVISHEISHAFDTNGAQFDKDGSLVDWWTEEDYKAFKDRADKLIKYFDSITVWEGQKVIGNNVQTEAIADLAGMKAVLKIAEGKEDFDYDAFFKAYAATRRVMITPEEEEYFLAQDPHPLDYLRTNVTVQQFDEFYETYDVKEGDNMYLAPEDRVSVW
ncbi:MAG: M13 family metallopeptidase [Lachnospiraceae bacterium]|nr:M13 family metallopeptidase [Lachnospiraceae bacterium]